MFRLTGVCLLLSAVLGCIVTTDFSDLSDSPPVSPETKQKVDELARKLQVALQNKDWPAIAPLYWSGAQMTPEKAKEAYGGEAEQAGSMSKAEIEYTAYDTSDLVDEVGEDVLQDIGAPHELYRGFADIYYVDPSTKEGLALTLEIGEENGQYVILGIYDIYAYDDN
ncbi:hypothetical protein LOC68_12930 [Blastopirellula sp. JC732]|uniref:DUF4019 domain-containing protein n=1 Tax=Blastopirellula sediminis TaxID=2894196 RepID=A0A9X1MM16_9BACT|nr:hypothetical protein [Blastopirellula sediminis]MCC9607406.1 hypothetical protein [Blastopirellula sediminis]MCC9629301.1 hypothetical protein [Blastopirellula sediminis]